MSTQVWRCRRRAGRVLRWVGDARGASFAEYMIIVGVVALLAINAFSLFGSQVSGRLGSAAADLSELGL